MHIRRAEMLFLMPFAALAPVMPLFAQTSDDVASARPPEPEAITPDVPDATASGGNAGQSDRSLEDIFQDVFGRDRPDPLEDEYPVLIAGINVGQYRVRPDSETQDGSVDGDFVANVLAPLTIGQARTDLERLGELQEVSFQALQSVGLPTVFDATNLALRIEIPISVQAVRGLNLRALRNRADIEFMQQADVSAYLSARTGLAFVEDSAVTGTGFDRVTADFDFALNIKGFVLEGDLRYDDRRQDRRWRRGDVRLTYDSLDSLIRYEVGDLSIGRRPYQSSPRIGGISAFRNYRIDPYRNIRPNPDRQFELDEPARVEVLINGIASRTFDLPAGRFSLRELPLVPSASNDIELRITYASGRVSVVSYPAFYDLDLLAEGLTEFAINFGLPYEDRSGVRVYDDSDYNGIGYIRHGLSNTLSLGLNWQGSTQFDTVGTEVIWASPLGTIGIDAATDIRDPRPNTSEFNLQYRWRDTDRQRNRTVDGTLTLTGREYRTLDQLFGGGFASIQARARAGQNIGPDGSGQVFAGYQKLRDGFGSSWFVGANYTHSFSFGSMSAGLEYQDAPDRQGIVVRAAFTVPFGRGSVSGSASSESNRARVEFSQFATGGVGAIGLRGIAERRDGSDRQQFRANYTGNRFEAAIGQRADNYFSDNDRRDLRTEVSFGSAFVMADGHFGISRPVDNAFAIFSPQTGDVGYNIAVEPRTGFGSSDTRYSAYSGTFGPAVVPQLPAYLNRSLEVDAPDAPPGTSLGGQVFSVRPGYRSGYILPVGSERNVSVLGNMVDVDGDPIAYAVGEAEEIDGSLENGPISVFTNATGRFFIEGVEAGKSYRISLSINGNIITQDLTIPEEFSGIYTLDEPLVLEIDVAAAQEGGG